MQSVKFLFKIQYSRLKIRAWRLEALYPDRLLQAPDLLGCRMCVVPDLPTGLAGHADACFSFFQLSCGKNYTVHTRGHSGLVELVLLVLLVFVFIFFSLFLQLVLLQRIVDVYVCALRMVRNSP